MIPMLSQSVRKIWDNLSVSFNVTHVAFCFFLFPWFLSSNKVISNLTIQVLHLCWAYFLYVTEVVIYLVLSFITGYETFNNWHFARSVLNHFVSTISFIGLHTIIALGLQGLKKKQIYIVMRNIIFFNGGNVIQSPCLFFREFQITRRRDKSCQSSDSTFLETAINMEKRSIVIRLKTVFYWVTTVRLLCNFMTLSKALSHTCFSPLKKEQIVLDEH